MMTFLWVKHASGAVAAALLQSGMTLFTLFSYIWGAELFLLLLADTGSYCDGT